MSLSLFALLLLSAAGAPRAVDFQPDEPISSIKVKVHTADVSEAGTDDDVYIRLFGGSRTEIDTDWYDDFERNDTDTYTLPHSYFNNAIVNDIDRVCVEKSSDGVYGGWALGYVTLTVNGKILYSSLNPNDASAYRWLEDDHRTWCAGDFKQIEFTDPVIDTLGFWDADPDKPYNFPLSAHGGRKPLTWKIITQTGDAFVAPAVLKPVQGNTDGTQMVLSAHTATTQTTKSWFGFLRVTDADGRTDDLSSSMSVIFALPPPTVSEFTPGFGWPKLNSAAPTATKVVVKGDNFDSRPPQGRTHVFFNGKEAKVLQITNLSLEAEVPKGATPGPIKVKTEFGEALSKTNFTAHPNGYRLESGMSWVNAASNLPDVYEWERYEQTFGVCDMWICVLGHGTIPDPISTLFYLISKGSVSAGVCHGMSMTSLQMKAGILPQANYASQDLDYPLDGSIWDLTGPNGPSGGLSKTVQNRQLVVWSDEGLSYFLDALDDIPNADGLLCTMDARTALNDLKSSLSSGNNDPRMIAFAKNCSPFAGHVVVPYVVDPKEEIAGIDFENIRVWNPNTPASTGNPADPNSLFKVRSNSGLWSFEFDDGSSWDGLYMYTIPLSAYGHQEDWSLPGLGVLTGTIGLLPGIASAAGGGGIQQVTDKDGRKLFMADGSVQPDPTLRAQGVYVGPDFTPEGGVKGPSPKLIALRGADPVNFTLSAPSNSPTAPPADPTLFSVFSDQQGSMSVEDVTAPMDVQFDPKTRSVRVAPLRGAESPLLRMNAHFPGTSESLGYAVRVHDVAPGKPVTFAPAAGGRSFTLRANDAPLTLDLEVTHTDRIGRQRILESDAITLPANALSTVDLTSPDDLDKTGAKPIRMKVDAGGGATETMLGENLTGITLVMPQHAIAPSASITVVPVVVDASRTKSAFSAAVTFKSMYGPAIGGQQGGKLAFNIPPGTQVAQVVGVDDAGHRSFPRTVFLTQPDGNEKSLSPLTVFGEETSIDPGTTVPVPLGAYLTDFFPTDHLSIDLSSRMRLSGKGPQYPLFQENGFELSPELQAAGGAATLTVGAAGLSAQLDIHWDPAQPKSGKIDLGKLRMSVPDGTAFGNTFLVNGKASATAGTGGSQKKSDVNVLPTMIRVWGGGDPNSLSVSGPAEVAEGADAPFLAAGAPAGAANAGWWSEGLGGKVQLTPDPSDGGKVKVTGLKAGYVKLHAIVGTKTAEAVLKVTPTVKAPSLGLSNGRAPARAIPLPRALGDVDGDDLIQVTDAIEDLRIIVGLSDATAESMIAGDTNGDDSINISDVIRILRAIVGLEPL